MKIGVAGYLPSDWRKIDLAATRRVVDAGFSGGKVFIDQRLCYFRRLVGRTRRDQDDDLLRHGILPPPANGEYTAQQPSAAPLRTSSLPVP